MFCLKIQMSICFNNGTMDYEPRRNDGWTRMTVMVALLVVSSFPPWTVKLLMQPGWSEPSDVKANWYPQRGTREGDYRYLLLLPFFFLMLEYFENGLPLRACYVLYKIRYYGLCWELNYFLFYDIVHSARVYIKYPNLKPSKIKTRRRHLYIVPQFSSPWWVVCESGIMLSIN